MRCWIAVPRTTPAHRRDREQQRRWRRGRCRRGRPGRARRQADDDDRGEAGAGREALAVAEPEDQQRHDDRAAADPEEAAEDAGEGADRGELAERVVRGRAGGHLAILEAVPPDSETREARDWAARWRRCARSPARAAILTDVDGTLAPIVERAEEAAVPAAAREAAGGAERALRAGRLHLRPAGRGGAAAGRRRRARLRRQPRAGAAAAGGRGAAADPSVRGREREAAEFLAALDASGWRRPGCGGRTRARSRRCTGAAPRTSGAPRAAPTRSRAEAGRAGLSRAGAARCWSCGRPAAAARTRAVAALLADRRRDRAIYAGDDRTDLDAFRRLRELREEGRAERRGLRRRRLRRGPPELAEECDLTVDGPAGWLAMLEGLAGVDPAMPYTDLLRITVFITAAEATALGAITALAANRDGDTRTLLVAAGWWLIALAIGIYLGRPAARRRRRPRRPGPRPHGHLAARRDARPDRASPGSGRSPSPRSPPASSASSSPASPRRRRLRPDRLARLAHPRGRRPRHRAARRRQVLRRPQLRPAPDRAGPDAGPAQRPAGERLRPQKRQACRPQT